jgi:hypothetical protein
MGAHHEGIAQAIAYLDAHVDTRRGHGGREKVSARGLVVVGFDHRTSREGDPLPHTHLIIANRTQGPDGRWTTLDGRDLYAHRRAADAIYRAAYQRSLTCSLGIAWGEADRWGNRPIVGMPTEVVRAFSKRTQQITRHLAQLQEQGRQRTPALVRFAVHATRQAKRHEDPETLHTRWRSEALARGIDPDRLVGEVSGRAREQDRAVSNLAVKRVFNRLAGPEGLTAGASTFARQDVVVALGAELIGVDSAELGALTDRFLAERAVAVIDDRAEPGIERRWSTLTCSASSAPWSSLPRPVGLSRPGWSRPSWSARRLPPTPRSARTRPAWSATSASAATESPWWKAGRAPARRSRWGSPATPGSSVAGGCSAPRRPGSPL